MRTRTTGMILLAAAASITAAGDRAARAQEAGGEEMLRVRITDPGRDLLRLALPRATGDGDLATLASETEARDLDIVGLFRILDPSSFPSALLTEGLGFSSALWSQVGAQGVAKMQVTRKGASVTLEGRLYMLGRGEAPVLTRTYQGSDARVLAHDWSNDVVEQFTGEKGVFGSRIAFAAGGRSPREIASVEMDGTHMAVLTRMGSDSLLPAYAPGGGEIAFTSFLKNNPDLWLVSAGGGRARRISNKPGLNTGACWAPDGGSLALTLSFDGNPEIYRLEPSSGALTRLTKESAIDSSPAFSPDGSQIAFVSNRQGSPQIFLMPASGGAARRLTFQGKYNQEPAFNPRKDRPLIAFTGRDEYGVFDVFIYDLRTGKIDRVTQGKGSNRDPSWSPDGRLLVYSSSRGGLFIANPETHHEVQIWKGAAESPSWGPAPRH